MSHIHTRELTAKEKRAIRKLVTTTCATYDPEYECLLLEGTCYMFTIAFNTSGLCRYFRDAVLPTDPALEAVFTGQPVKPCQRCSRKFPVNGRQAYCSERCASVARRDSTAKRVRKHRNRNGTDVTL